MIMMDKINTSFLLSEDETVKRDAVTALDNRQWEYTLFSYILGLYFIISALANMLFYKHVFQNMLGVVIGIFVCFFYELFTLRIFVRKRARKLYQLHSNHRLSTRFYLEQEKIMVQSDKYRFTAKPQELWKCLETSDLFIIYFHCECCTAVPKRALSTPEIGMVRNILQNALPQGQYVKTGK